MKNNSAKTAEVISLEALDALSGGGSTELGAGIFGICAATTAVGWAMVAGPIGAAVGVAACAYVGIRAYNNEEALEQERSSPRDVAPAEDNSDREQE